MQQNITKHTIEAVIFDMDGVLVNSEQVWPQVKGNFFYELSDTWSSDLEYKILGKSLKGIHEFMVAEFGATISFEEFKQRYTDKAQEVYEQRVSLMPGAQETLAAVSAQSLPLALASSSLHSWIDMVVDRFDLRNYFQHIVSSEDVNSVGKPAPDIYLYTAKKLQIVPENCLVIEDSKHGIASAKAAGMIAIGYEYPENEQDLTEADYVINNLSKILEFF